jgi:hypothetical protein
MLNEAIESGDCAVIEAGAKFGKWQAALAAGPVIAPLNELVAPLDFWELFPQDSLFDFSISPVDGFYSQVPDASSPLGIRRNCPARMKGANWSLVQEIMTHLVKQSKDNWAPLPDSLQTLELPNEYDPLEYGPVPLSNSFENKHRMYLSGESNSEMQNPSSEKLRVIQHKVAEAMGRDWEIMNVWVSAGNTMSNLHFDGGDNWLCQLSGTKTATMFAHEDSDHLYPILFNKPGDVDHQHVVGPNGELGTVPIPQDRRDDKVYAAVKEHAPNLTRFPNFPRASRKVCRIKPGQCLGIPHHWWHNIRSGAGEINFSLNFGFGPAGTSDSGWSTEMVKEMSVRMSEMKARQHLMRTKDTG